MDFLMRDLYPTVGMAETSTEVIPEPDDQSALTENIENAEKVSTAKASKKNILIGFAILVFLVVFLGGAE